MIKKTKKNLANVTGEEKWEKTFKENSSIFIPAKEILSHSYKLAASISVDNVRFDDTYIDIINSAKIDITMGKNPDSRAAMLRRIEKMTNGGVKLLLVEAKTSCPNAANKDDNEESWLGGT